MIDSVHFCGGPPPAVGKVQRYRFVCPWCLGWGTWASGESCKMCAGGGLTDDPNPGVDLYTDYPPGTEPPETQPEPIPRPPGVMRQPCVDCAFRPGSPEADYQRLLPGAEEPFYCHHGLIKRGDGYLSGSTVAGRPLGALVCASWWAVHMEGGQAPGGSFRDPGGSDRAADR